MGYRQAEKNLRGLVAGTNTQIPLSNGTYVEAVNFDNAATTPPFLSVLQEIMRFSPWYSSIHRGAGYKSMLSSKIYEDGRKVIKNFVNADSEKDVVIYTKSATESVNLLAHRLKQEQDGRDIILCTMMEHSANDLPWRDKFKVVYVGTDERGRLSSGDLKAKLSQYGRRIKLVAVTGASNVTGYINPIHSIARLAHGYGAKILVDGAQLVPHSPVDMKSFDSAEHIDFLVFSAHKMYAPFGVGVLIGPKDTFEKGAPFCRGGGAVKLVTLKEVLWAESPLKDEAGSPNIEGVVALVAAIKTLESIGMEFINRYEDDLLRYAFYRLNSVPGINIYCDRVGEEKRVSIIPFNIEGIPHQLLAGMLSLEAGIAVRNGFFCSHLYSQSLLGLNAEDMEYYLKNTQGYRPGMVRLSFGLYNTYSEIDRLIYTLNTIVANKSHYLQKYTHPLFPYRFPSDV